MEEKDAFRVGRLSRSWFRGSADDAPASPVGTDHARGGWPLDAVALWQRAKDQDPTINKVTVYRTLAMLKKQGLVDELDLMHLDGGKHYYEAKTTRDHIHLACMKCGRIQEFESSLFEKLKGQIEREQQFRINYRARGSRRSLRPLQVIAF